MHYFPDINRIRMNRNKSRQLKSVLYLAALCLVGFFIYREGEQPWLLISRNWAALASTIAITAAGTVVQASTFRACLPENASNPRFLTLLQIWNISAITSLLAPILTGITLRAAMLAKHGVSIRDSSIATFKQTLANIECAAIVGATALLLTSDDSMHKVGVIVATSLLAVYLLPRVLKYWPITTPTLRSVLLKMSGPFAEKRIFKPIFWGQLILMATNYYFVFLFYGNPLSAQYALLLAAVTIMSGLLFMFPNGVGVLEAVWILVGTNLGMTSAESAAIILTLRLGFLASALLMWPILQILSASRRSQ